MKLALLVFVACLGLVFSNSSFADDVWRKSPPVDPAARLKATGDALKQIPPVGQAIAVFNQVWNAIQKPEKGRDAEGETLRRLREILPNGNYSQQRMMEHIELYSEKSFLEHLRVLPEMSEKRGAYLQREYRKYTLEGTRLKTIYPMLAREFTEYYVTNPQALIEDAMTLSMGSEKERDALLRKLTREKPGAARKLLAALREVAEPEESSGVTPSAPVARVSRPRPNATSPGTSEQKWKIE